MINRILIRMKVVQLLYSYLLNRNDFKLADKPSRDTREAAVAHRLYLQLLSLILQLSGYKYVNGHSLTADPSRQGVKTALARSLYDSSDIRSFITDGIFKPIDDAAVFTALYAIVTASAPATEYQRKRNKTIDSDIQLWNVLLDTVVAKDAQLQELLRRDSDFSLKAFESAIAMVKASLASYADVRNSLEGARKSLDASLDKTYQLYHLLLLLPAELTRLEQSRLDEAREKYVPTSEDLNPNTRFIDNAYVKAIESSEKIQAYIKSSPINWDEDFLTLRRMLDEVKQSAAYQEYMEATASTPEQDCEFWRNILKTVILPGDALAEMLENKSVYWNDDLDIMSTFALKTIKRIGISGDTEDNILPQYKDDDDARFGQELFGDAVNNRETYIGYIHSFINSQQWDPERMAFMDLVIMLVAISEIINFPAIPIEVTMNEYVEIANCYSTPRSGQFVNGILFAVAKHLKEKGIIDKRC